MISWSWKRIAGGCVACAVAVFTAVPVHAEWTTGGGPNFGIEATDIDIDPTDGSVWIIGRSDDTIHKFDRRGSHLVSFGGFGTDDGQFNLAIALAVGPDGDVYVADKGNSRIKRFTSEGDFVRSYGSTASTPWLQGIDVAPDGTIYVGDYQTGVRAFAPDGTPVRTYLSSTVPSGFAVAVDHDGYLWASDFRGDRDKVHKIDPATGAIVATITGLGQPSDIVIGPDGRVSIVNFNTSTIRTYETDGTFVEESEPTDGMFKIAIDDYGRLYVYGSSNGNRVRVMLPERLETTVYLGATNNSAIDPAFETATIDHTTELLDFEGDGFDDLAAHTYRPITPDHYADLGVTLNGLDARSVGSEPWAHSQPIGAWQTGFNQHRAEPYSIEFDTPVASFGLFLNDVESEPVATIQLTDGRREFVAIPRESGADETRFVGIVAPDDVIMSVEIDSFGDFHIIDDVQFGRLGSSDDIAPTIALASPVEGATFNLRQVVMADYSCADEGGSGLTSCDGQVPSGSALDTSNPGTFPFVVTAADAAGNTAQAASSYTVITEPIFGVVDVSPAARAAGSGVVTLFVTGDGFLPGARARFAGTGVTVQATTVLSATTLEVQATVGGAAALGARDVTVTNPGGAVVTCSGCFIVNPKPTVAAVAPASRPHGATHTLLDVTGTGFQVGAAASFGGTGVTVHGLTFNGAGSLTLDVSIDPAAATGARALTLVNPDGGTVTKANALTVNALPTATTATPNRVRQGRTASVAIAGSGFAVDFATNGGTISFGAGVAVTSVVRNSAVKLTASVVVADDADPGSRAVTIVNPDGGATSCVDCMVVVADPEVAGVAPSALARGVAGQVLTISGSGFQNGAAVSVGGGGVTVGGVAVIDSGTLAVTVTIGGGATLGSRDVVVTNPDTGAATCVACLTINARPTIATLSPNAQARGVSGQTVVLTGTGFQSGALVTMSGSGVSADVVTVSPTQLTLSVTVAPGAATGQRTVTVTNPDGGWVSKGTAFRVL